MKTHTRGNIIIEDIKVWDTMWECEYGACIEVEVLTLPELKEDQYTWKAKNKQTGDEIDYLMTIWLEHYSPALYSYKAYSKI